MLMLIRLARGRVRGMLRGVAHSERTRKKDSQRFYLLPGMGGSSLRRKRKLILIWSVVAGIVASGLVAFMLYLLNQSSKRGG